MRPRTLLLVLLALSLAVCPSIATPSVAFGSAPLLSLRQNPLTITARLGISAGDAIQNVERGTGRQALERIIPELFQSATMLGVRIETVSVGRGFWSEDGEVDSENDLDLVVSGVRENVLALGAMLGQRWGQSAVLAWEIQAGAEMLTATLPLPGGTTALSDATFEQLAKVLTDGGHIRYAGTDSLVFVAHTGDDTPDEFRARMTQAQTILAAAGLRTGTLSFGQASMVVLERDTYQQFIDGAIRGKAA
ncbi:MAG: hypothetical protein AB7P40_29670 [Chloroflexota bacterium]